MGALSEKVRPSELIAFIGGILLLISTFFPWFSLPGVDELRKIAPEARVVGTGDTGSIDLNVWDLTFARWFVYLTILVAVWMFFAALFSKTADWSMILATPLVIFSFIALICLLYRALDVPRDLAEHTVWFWLALVAAFTTFNAACWAIRDDTVPAGFTKPPRPEFVEVE